VVGGRRFVLGHCHGVYPSIPSWSILAGHNGALPAVLLKYVARQSDSDILYHPLYPLLVRNLHEKSARLTTPGQLEGAPAIPTPLPPDPWGEHDVGVADDLPGDHASRPFVRGERRYPCRTAGQRRTAVRQIASASRRASRMPAPRCVVRSKTSRCWRQAAPGSLGTEPAIASSNRAV
jgi:hypothetical protein